MFIRSFHYVCFLITLLLCSSHASVAGTFIHLDQSGEPVPEIDHDSITHPEGYLGTGGELMVNVCITTDSQDQQDMEIPTENAIRTLNALVPTTNNWDRSPAAGVVGFDYESVLLHEIGHCVGLGHTNLATESGVSNSNQDFSRSGNGQNNVFDLNDGADNVAGSSDDIRGDDINRGWFRKSNNNPFTIASVVDASTYSIDLNDLPTGHSFVANADRDVSVLLGIPNTEAVMQQGTFSREAQRTLGHDDVAMIRLGMSGLDETAATSDDYVLKLNYLGVSDANACDITIKIDPANSGFAFCSISASSIPRSEHKRLSSTRITMGGNFNWHFNQVTMLEDSDGDGLLDSLENSLCTSSSDADTDDDGLSDGVEDANQNGLLDSGETDPCDIDSDNDNIQDGTESGVTSVGSDTNLTIFIPDADPSTTTLPLNSDSDMDGFEDGEEDVNANGQVDSGESDPNETASIPISAKTIPALPLVAQLITLLIFWWMAMVLGRKTRKSLIQQ